MLLLFGIFSQSILKASDDVFLSSCGSETLNLLECCLFSVSLFECISAAEFK